MNAFGMLSGPGLLLLLFCRTVSSSLRFRGRLKLRSLGERVRFDIGG